MRMFARSLMKTHLYCVHLVYKKKVEIVLFGKCYKQKEK